MHVDGADIYIDSNCGPVRGTRSDFCRYNSVTHDHVSREAWPHDDNL